MAAHAWRGLLSLLYATTGPAMCTAPVGSRNKRAGYSRLCTASLDVRQVNACPHPRSLAEPHSLTGSLRILQADRPYFQLGEISVTGPLRCYRWRSGLWHCLWPLRPVVVMCETVLPALAVPWGATLPAGRRVRMMIASWPWSALHYIRNEKLRCLYCCL